MSDESPAPKLGIVRPGNERPFKKATEAEIAERAEEIAYAIVRQMSKHEIHKMFCAKFDVHWKTIDRYMGRARQLIAERSNLTPESARELSVSVWLDIIKTGSNRERLDAASCIVETCGGKSPTRQEISGPNGNPIELLAGARPLQHLSLEELGEIASGKKIIELKPSATEADAKGGQ